MMMGYFFRSNIFLVLVLVLMISCGASKKVSVRQNNISKVIRTARSFTGTPYKYGGLTRSGMDCSGLMINAYRSISFSIPRTSRAQSEMGKKVGRSQIQPGDWVFFATGKKKRKITHVGLVTEVKKGNVRFIHASTKLGVVESNLSVDYYDKRFIKAMRPF